MRRLRAFAVCLWLVLGLAACNRREKLRIETIEDPVSTLASVLHVADPRSSPQLLKGFHDIEQNSWRWTMGKFAVTLQRPAGSEQRGATLQVKFGLPEAVVDRLKSITLSANVNGTPIEAETFAKVGEHTYTKVVPASALGIEAVGVDFALDKFLQPGSVDQRELGIVVSTIGLEAK